MNINKVLSKAVYCRFFEKRVQQLLNNKTIQVPTYLSIGQEMISAVMSEYFPKFKIFGQHRAHSTYLCYGGDPVELAGKLLGTSNKKEGSASISSKEIGMYGHSGLMGDQVPIAVGACLAGIGSCLAIMGDASGEEDYALASFGFAVKHKLPILFLVEDNNLSILTEKRVRRDWNHHEVAKSFGLKSYNCNDSIEELSQVCENAKHNLPALINVNTNRRVWHAGGGVDDYHGEDRLELELKANPLSNINDIKLEVENLWDSQLQKL